MMGRHHLDLKRMRKYGMEGLPWYDRQCRDEKFDVEFGDKRSLSQSQLSFFLFHL